MDVLKACRQRRARAAAAAEAVADVGRSRSVDARVPRGVCAARDRRPEDAQEAAGMPC
jgi:hypothetical protein